MQSQTFEPSVELPEYAGFGSRFAAFGIDLILVNVAVLPFRFVFWMMTEITGLEVFRSNILFHYNFIDIFCYITISSYFVLMTYLYGQTLGKMLLQLRVVSVAKAGKSFTNILYRETVGRYLSSILLVGYLMAAFHLEKAGLHDRLCNTRVVHRKKAQSCASY